MRPLPFLSPLRVSTHTNGKPKKREPMVGLISAHSDSVHITESILISLLISVWSIGEWGRRTSRAASRDAHEKREQRKQKGSSPQTEDADRREERRSCKVVEESREGGRRAIQSHCIALHALVCTAAHWSDLRRLALCPLPSRRHVVIAALAPAAGSAADRWRARYTHTSTHYQNSNDGHTCAWRDCARALVC